MNSSLLTGVKVLCPTLGKTVSDCKVTTLYSDCSDAVSEGEMLLELETDKVTIEVPSPIAGRVVFKVSVGDVLRPGDVIARVYPSLSK